MRQERVLLALVETMYFIDKHQGAAPLLLGQLRFFNGFTNVLDAAQHRADSDELGIEGAGHEARDGGFAGARRAPENTAVRLAGLESQAQRHTLTQQMLLTHHLAEGLGAQALGQRRKRSDGMLHTAIL